MSGRTVVLLLDPDDARRQRLRGLLRGPDRLVVPAGTWAEAATLARSSPPSVVVLAPSVPDLDAARLHDTVRQRIGVPVVDVEDLAALGPEAAAQVLADAIAQPSAPAEVRVERKPEPRRVEEVGDPTTQLLTQSPLMLAVFDQIRLVARTDATALILGETGTGKELVSRAIHERSRRKERPFVAVNCGAFTETLLESELFGHERGAFTGAVGRRDGLFEMADGGSLFLDELGETTLNVQVNLLRVLEEMRFRRVGGRELVDVDVRIIAATNVHLDRAVAEGKFREDLYYRLNVFPILLPPLRERMEDVPLLMRHFFDRIGEDYGLEAPRLAPDAIAAILAYRWPGNVRQLRAACERWMIGRSGQRLRLEDLGPEILGSRPVAIEAPRAAPTRTEVQQPVHGLDPELPLPEQLREATAALERAYFLELLARNRSNVAKTAAAAGVSRRTLYNRLAELGIDPRADADAVGS
jgi:DNA-binding NtrC family response regulator